jgi:hypothetical protein
MIKVLPAVDPLVVRAEVMFVLWRLSRLIPVASDGAVARLLRALERAEAEMQMKEEDHERAFKK